jgi:hypothetical protein
MERVLYGLGYRVPEAVVFSLDETIVMVKAFLYFKNRGGDTWK